MITDDDVLDFKERLREWRLLAAEYAETLAYLDQHLQPYKDEANHIKRRIARTHHIIGRTEAENRGLQILSWKADAFVIRFDPAGAESRKYPFAELIRLHELYGPSAEQRRKINVVFNETQRGIKMLQKLLDRTAQNKLKTRH